MTARIRDAEERDLPALTRIYNHYVAETPITFDVEPYSVEQRAEWLAGFGADGPYRCLVADEGSGALGWACSRQFRVKAAYDTSVETSIYLAPEAGGRGLGTRLYEALFEHLAGHDVHMALGGVTLPNAASVALHRRFGFESIGVFREVGRKFGRYWDVEWFEKRLSD